MAETMKIKLLAEYAKKYEIVSQNIIKGFL